MQPEGQIAAWEHSETATSREAHDIQYDNMSHLLPDPGGRPRPSAPSSLPASLRSQPMLSPHLFLGLAVRKNQHNVHSLSHSSHMQTFGAFSDGLEDWYSIPGRGRNLSPTAASRPVLGPIQPPIQFVLGALFPGGEAAGTSS
jgi:hypothetical protein